MARLLTFTAEDGAAQAPTASDAGSNLSRTTPAYVGSKSFKVVSPGYSWYTRTADGSSGGTTKVPADRSYFHRLYLYISAAPSTQHEIVTIANYGDAASKSCDVSVELGTDRKLYLYFGSTNAGTKGAQIGSASAALSTGTWYELQIAVNVPSSGSGWVEALLAQAGSTPASWVPQTSQNWNLSVRSYGSTFIFGNPNGVASSETSNWDDVFVNDSTTGSNNSWVTSPDTAATVGIASETDTGLGIGIQPATGALSGAASDVLGRIAMTFTPGGTAPTTFRVFRSADGSTFAELNAAPTPWQASHAYSPGDVVGPVTPNGKSYRMAGYVAGTSGGSEPSWVGSGQASDGVLRWEEYTPVKIVDNGDGTWTITDLRPANGSQPVPLASTAYYKVIAVRNGTEAAAQTSAVSAVSAVDKSARELGTWSAIHTVMATQATREDSSHLSYAYPHRYLMSAAYVAATYPAKKTEALTDLDTWWTFVKTQITAEGLFIAGGYPTYCYIGHVGEMLPYLVACARLLRNALGTDTTSLPSGLTGAPALAADMIAKADAMGVGMIDYLERYSVSRNNLGSSDPLPANATAWAGSTSYQPGAIVRPTSANGRVYRMVANGAKTSGSSEPTWPTNTGKMTTTVDGGCWWQDCTDEYPAWQASTVYRLGQVVRPTAWTGAPIVRTGTITSGSNVITGLSTTADLAVGMGVSSGLGVITSIVNSTSVQVSVTAVVGATLSLTFTPVARTYRCITPGTSSGSEPTWPTSGEVTDGAVRWEETTVTGDIFANVYSPTSPYNAVNAAGTGVSDELARVIAGFAGLLNDPDATHFKSGGSKRSTAFTIVVDHVKVLATHFVGNGANIDDPTWQAQDSLYMSYTMHLLAVGLHEWQQVYTPATANHRTLEAIVGRGLDWFAAQYATEPNLGNDGHPAAIATPYTGRAELGWRKIPYATAGVADPLGDRIYSSALLPYQYLPAGSAYSMSSYDVDDLNFLSALGLPAAYGTPQVQAVGVGAETDSGLAIAPSGPQSQAVGVATETDTGFTITPDGTLGVGVATETDSGLDVVPSVPQSAAVGVGAETDSGIAVTVPGAFTMNMQLPPGTILGAYRRHEWIGSEVPVRGAGSYPGAAVQEVTVNADGEVTFLLPPGSYIAWAAAFPTRRRFFVVTSD